MRAVVALVLVGCSGSELPEPVQLLELSDPQTHWDDALEVVPPIHLPQPSEGPAQVRVYLELPEQGSIQRVGPAWPPGTVADRVEVRGDRVVDVRGTRIDADGVRWHHVFRATHGDPSAPLVGVEWPAGDAEAAERAVDAFVGALRDAPVVQATRDPEAHLRGVRAKLDCDGCHEVRRPANRTVGEHGLVARGTDAAGWFTPATVLTAEAPLEAYGGWDPNLVDPFVRVHCENGPVRLPSGPGHASCPGDRVPVASLDLQAALAADDDHAVRTCATLRALVERLDDPSAFTDHPCLAEQP